MHMVFIIITTLVQHVYRNQLYQSTSDKIIVSSAW